MAEIDYEEIRRRNIAERQAEFAAFFKELKEDDVGVLEGPQEKRPRVQRSKASGQSSDEDSENRPPKKKRQRYISYRIDVQRTYNTRSRSRRNSENSFTDGNVDYKDVKDKNIYRDDENVDGELLQRLVPKGRSLKVIFPWAKTFEREMEVTRMDKWDVDKELAQEDEEGYETDGSTRKRKSSVHRVSKSAYDPSTIPSIDEITDAMLQNVADKSSGKVYCRYKGTSCHQCRQKTMDTKTVCRSGECIGVRGQFCGPCLRGRYGEDAVTVLKDPNWSCPPCRGLCNCSICRTRNGQRPTGILAPVAQEEGYSSVMDYLQAASGDDDEAPGIQD